jgi:hypothetical protein
VDWAANPALLAPAVQPLAKPWCSTENGCPSVGYQQAVIHQTRPELGPVRPGPAADVARIESAPASDVVRTPFAFDPVRHLYMFLSLRR